MKADTLREMLHKAPFRPFAIRMDDGRVHPVLHPDYLFFVPGGDTAIVAEKDGRFHIVDIPHVNAISVPRPKRKAGA